jgi:uncharacterized protein
MGPLVYHFVYHDDAAAPVLERRGIMEQVNRLGASTSPYLLQHKDNPVDWWEWSDDAFAEARRLDRPVLLSVGYAACHWCHVMAHQSFEDRDVAALMNANFVSVKVDREERPDVDSVYMTATTAMTGQGGWPMTCLLTPDGAPFFAGTYFPKQGFLQLLAAATQAWAQRRSEIAQSGTRVVETLRRMSAAQPAAALSDKELRHAAQLLADKYDEANGGFGAAPKFPPSMVLEFLLRHSARTGDARSLELVTGTCEAMARGGMYDQLAGGFARYSVDSGWVIPHFEKMLYDNAQLLRVYLHLWRQTGSAMARRIASETAAFLLSDLGTTEGGFASALDADTDGVEGLTYVWTPDELTATLGEQGGSRAAELFSVTATGTFEAGTSTLQLRMDPVDERWFATVRAALVQARRRRPQPARDEKVVTSWNGLAIAALAEAGVLLRTPAFLDAAVRAAELLLTTHLVDDRLRRASRSSVVGLAAGTAEDYGNLAEGLLVLHQATGEGSWLQAAEGLLDTAIMYFADPNGGFYDTADDAEQLFIRPADPADNASPAGQSSLAGALLSYSALTGETRHRDHAQSALARAGTLAATEPRFAGWTLAVAEALLAGPVQVAIVGSESTTADAARLLDAAWSSPSPGLVRVSGRTDQPGVPLLARRLLLDGAAAAYVCRGFVCDRPVSGVEELRQAMEASK